VGYHIVDPYAAWQRGTNKNANGLLRQDFPKGTDFRSVSDDDLETAARRTCR
jgi:IS30 family transposase